MTRLVNISGEQTGWVWSSAVLCVYYMYSCHYHVDPGKHRAFWLFQVWTLTPLHNILYTSIYQYNIITAGDCFANWNNILSNCPLETNENTENSN